MRIIGLDPGLQHTGWGVIDQDGTRLSFVAAGRISTSSPIGRGLLGKKPGDEVRIQTPNGVKEFEVRKLQTIYDREEAE